MRIILPAAACGAACLIALVTPASAQSAGTPATEALRTTLLRPGGWVAELGGTVRTTGREVKGQVQVVFEQRKDLLVAVFDYAAGEPRHCERETKLDASMVKFDACRDTAVVLTYDATDAAFPLKGASPVGTTWKLRPK